MAPDQVYSLLSLPSKFRCQIFLNYTEHELTADFLKTDTFPSSSQLLFSPHRWPNIDNCINQPQQIYLVLIIVNFSSCRRMGQNCSILLMGIVRGLIIWETWRQMARGVITWFCMLRQTAIKHAFAWSPVCRFIMMWPSTQTKILAAAAPAPAGLCWGMSTNITL